MAVLSRLRHWMIRSLVGRSSVVMNTEVRGMAVLLGQRDSLVSDVRFDMSPNLYDGDPYEWFTPSRPQPYAILIPTQGEA